MSSTCRRFGGLFLLYSSLGDGEGLRRLSKLAVDQGKTNVAFASFLLLNQLEDAVNLLCATSRIPEAAFFARTYLPSHISRLVKLWREDLQTVNVKAAESLADPMEYENLFPDLQWALKAEKKFNQVNSKPASHYLRVRDHLERNLIQELKELGENDALPEEDEEISQPTCSILTVSASSPVATKTVTTSSPLTLTRSHESSPLTLTRSHEPQSPREDMESEVDMLLKESSVDLGDVDVDVDVDVDDILKNETLLQE